MTRMANGIRPLRALLDDGDVQGLGRWLRHGLQTDLIEGHGNDGYVGALPFRGVYETPQQDLAAMVRRYAPEHPQRQTFEEAVIAALRDCVERGGKDDDPLIAMLVALAAELRIEAMLGELSRLSLWRGTWPAAVYGEAIGLARSFAISRPSEVSKSLLHIVSAARVFPSELAEPLLLGIAETKSDLLAGAWAKLAASLHEAFSVHEDDRVEEKRRAERDLLLDRLVRREVSAPLLVGLLDTTTAEPFPAWWLETLVRAEDRHPHIGLKEALAAWRARHVVSDLVSAAPPERAVARSQSAPNTQGSASPDRSAVEPDFVDAAPQRWLREVTDGFQALFPPASRVTDGSYA